MRLSLVLTTFLGLATLQSGCRSNALPPSPPPSGNSDAGLEDAGSGVTTDGGLPPEMTLQKAEVLVPPDMKAEPFDVPRALNIPSQMQVSVWARVTNARFIAVSPEGTLLVSVPAQNKVMQVRPRPGQSP
ncbi:hypothetical protein D7V93_14710, partial [Corallococcus llansteffanensis]